MLEQAKKTDHPAFPREVEILLVEDSKADATFVLLALNEIKPKPNVFVASDGEEALDFLFCAGNFFEKPEPRRLRFVILDLQLPKIDGHEVLRQIRNSKLWKQIPVIIISSSNQESDIEKSYSLGVNSYVVKPYGLDGFRDALLQIGRYWGRLNSNSERSS